MNDASDELQSLLLGAAPSDQTTLGRKCPAHDGGCIIYVFKSFLTSLEQSYLTWSAGSAGGAWGNNYDNEDPFEEGDKRRQEEDSMFAKENEGASVIDFDAYEHIPVSPHIACYACPCTL